MGVSDNRQPPAVMLNPCLGLMRAFGRRGIPIVYIDSEPDDIASHSRYIRRRLKCPNPLESEAGFISALLDYGRQLDNRTVIIPNGDIYVLVMAKHKRKLEQFYILPIADYEVVNRLVKKRNLYKLLAEVQLPHPRTYFPEGVEELRLMGREVGLPYIIKPDDSMLFRKRFHEKCFVIDSLDELDRAVDKLRGTGFDFVIQEIIPGGELYNVSGCFNRDSEPLAVCGWDKIRQYPADFGCGTCCLSRWRPEVVAMVTGFFKAVDYRGVGEMELKRDPRDGCYKVIEVNVRTVSQNRLAAACGVDVEHAAYLDAIGHSIVEPVTQRDGVLWVEDFTDVLACLIQLKRGNISLAQITRYLFARKVHSVVAWDDPIPVIYRIRRLVANTFGLISGNG